MPSRANPPINTLSDGQALDTEEKLGAINDNNQMLSAKFGALTLDDLHTATGDFDVYGDIDVRNYDILSVESVLGIIDINQSTDPLQTILDSVGDDGGGVVFLPAHTSYGLTHTVMVTNRHSNVQIVGGGPSSVFFAVTSDANPLFQFDGCKRFALQDVHLSGKRGVISDVSAILVTNCHDCSGAIDRVRVGPRPGNQNANQTSLGFGGDGVRVLNSSELRIHDCTVVRCGDIGVKIHAAGTSPSSWCRNVILSDCAIEENGQGVFVTTEDFTTSDYTTDLKDITISSNRIRYNRREGVSVSKDASGALFTGNKCHNNSTFIPGGYVGLRIAGDSVDDRPVVGTLVVGNDFVDVRDSSAPSSTLTQKHHVTIWNDVTHTAIYYNSLNKTTGDRAAIAVHWNQVTDNPPHYCPIARDCNTLVDGGYYEVSRKDGGVTWTDWNNVGPNSLWFSNEIHEYGPTFGEVMRVSSKSPGNLNPDMRGISGGWLPSPDSWAERTSAGLGRPILNGNPMQMIDFVENFGNRGTPLTPNRYELQSSNSGEISGVSATFNVGPTMGGPLGLSLRFLVSRGFIERVEEDLGKEIYPSDMEVGVVTSDSPSIPSGAYTTAALWWFTPPGSPSSAMGMKHAVLTASTDGDSHIQIASNELSHIAVSGLSYMMARPTWVTVRY